jgi:hypothetical protein
VIVARQKEKLKLGEGAVFDPTRLKELPQENETWEADFEALPKPYTQNKRHYLGMVVTKTDGSILAETQVAGNPTVNDMATMLANAMLSPLTKDAHRPSRIYVRDYTPWDEVYPHLREIGIKVSIHREFPRIYAAFHDRLRQLRQMRSPGKVEPTTEQAKVAEVFPAIAKFVQVAELQRDFQGPADERHFYFYNMSRLLCRADIRLVAQHAAEIFQTANLDPKERMRLFASGRILDAHRPLAPRFRGKPIDTPSLRPDAPLRGRRGARLSGLEPKRGLGERRRPKWTLGQPSTAERGLMKPATLDQIANRHGLRRFSALFIYPEGRASAFGTRSRIHKTYEDISCLSHGQHF